MSLIRSGDTRPELQVRRLLHAMGYRYRLHVRSLPGAPDIVLRSRQKIVLVHGCFWHRHRCARGRSTPTTRAAFWREKFDANRRRDARNVRRLKRDGWSVLIVWECQLRHKQRLLARIENFLSSSPMPGKSKMNLCADQIVADHRAGAAKQPIEWWMEKFGLSRRGVIQAADLVSLKQIFAPSSKPKTPPAKE